jgi:hypothetical protein
MHVSTESSSTSPTQASGLNYREIFDKIDSGFCVVQVLFDDTQRAVDYVFLEVNPQGQFLFLETRAGLPLLDMWSEFLAAGRRDFVWREDHRIVRFEEYERFWRATGRDLAARHARFRKPLGVPDGAPVLAL